jgi:hypothetical protein
MIDASTIEVYINIKAAKTSPSEGAPMFSDLDETESSELKGPFPVLWEDANSARVGTGSREANLIGIYSTAEILIKFKLEDVLIDLTDPYGQTYLDRALHVVYNDREYQVLGYDRYGLGTVPPYIMAVALRGGYES